MKRLLVLAVAATAIFAHAQPHPGSNPITFVVPFPAGGPTDRVARDLAEAMLPKLFAPATIQRERHMVESQRQTILAASPAGVAAALRGMAARQSAVDYLPRISLPTLVVVGSEDAISTPDEMRTIAAAIPDSELAVIPNSGHMTPLENPAAFNTAIERFLARVESAS